MKFETGTLSLDISDLDSIQNDINNGLDIKDSFYNRVSDVGDIKQKDIYSIHFDVKTLLENPFLIGCIFKLFPGFK